MTNGRSRSPTFVLLTLLVLLTCNFPRVVIIHRWNDAWIVPWTVCAFVVTLPSAHLIKDNHRGHLQRSGKDFNQDEGEIFLSPPTAHREENRSIRFGRYSPLANESFSSGYDVEWLDPPVSVPDPYGWMRWRDDATVQEKQQILDHITKENDYTTNYFDADGDYRKRLQEQLVQEYQSFLEAPGGSNILGEIYQVYHRDGYYYYIRRPSHQPYPIHCRMAADQFEHYSGHLGGDYKKEANGEEVLLDENLVAKHFLRHSQESFFSIHSLVPIPLSHEQQQSKYRPLFGLAFSVDLVGNECYSIYLLFFPFSLDLYDTTPLLVAEATSGSIECVINETVVDHPFTLHYIAMDKNLCRPHQWVAWHFRDRTRNILYTESNQKYWGGLSKTSDGQYLLWTSKTSSGNVGSILFLNLQDANCRQPMRMRLETLSNLVIDHRNDHWWALNLSQAHTTSGPEQDSGMDCGSTTTQLYTSSKPDASTLTPIFWSHHLTSNSQSSPAIYLESLVTFSHYIVVQGRQEGLRRLWVLSVNEQNVITNACQLVATNKEHAYYIDLVPKQDYHSKCCVLWYESMVTPPQLWTVSLTDGTCHVIYAKNVAGYIKSDFRCQRLSVPSRDGIASIPVSVVHHNSVTFPCPVHLLGYGAYGHSLEPSFSTIRLPLLNRGIACVVAHVRGGGEMGRPWHDSGRSSFKTNSMNDFVDVASWLIDHNMTRSNLLVAEGRSAGGLLVASAMNQQPNLFHSVVLGVPFLDILCTMADSTIPLTTTEWDEWGNPHTIQGFQSIHEYAPMHNVVANTSYPSCLLVGGRYDPRVPYWEPLKFAANIRHISRTPRPILVKVDSSAGHSFGNNRTKFFEEMSFIYAFVIDQVVMRAC